MTLLRASNAPIGLDQGKPVSTSAGSPWQRPSDWITFTPPTATEQKVVGTVAIFNQDSNYMAVRVTTTDASQYTVDWGDGTSTNHNSGTTAEKNYVWSDISSGTLTSEGYRQAIVTITPTIAGRTFLNLSLSRKHSAVVASTSQGSPWLDVAISCPNGTVEFLWNSAGDTTDRVTPLFVEQVQILSCNTQSITYLFRQLISLQSVTLNNLSTTYISAQQGTFNGCRSLKVAPFIDFPSNITDLSSFFLNCNSLVEIPLYSTGSVSNWASTFSGCSSLETIPPLNTSSATNTNSMFNGCTSLKTIPSLNISLSTNTNSMFNGCTSLKTVPLFDTSLSTSIQSMFNGCNSLEAVPAFNFSSASSGNSAFAGCTSLKSVSNITFGNAMIAANAFFSNCSALRDIDIDVSGIVSFGNSNLGLGNASANLATASLGRAKITGNKFTQSFQNCQMGATQLNEMYTSLATLNPAITNASGTGTAVTYTVGTTNIRSFTNGRTVTITGVTPVAYNITGTVASVNNATGTFTITNTATGTYVSGGIASITSDRTITVTGNPGVATDDPTIATNKGWVVTG